MVAKTLKNKNLKRLNAKFLSVLCGHKILLLSPFSFPSPSCPAVRLLIRLHFSPSSPSCMVIIVPHFFPYLPILRHLLTNFIMSNDAQEVRNILQDAVNTRGRFYAHHHNFSVRFEDDDTNAARDAAHFQNILRALDLPPAKDVILGRTALWDFTSALKKLGDILDVQDGRTLLIFHYAGHAITKEDSLHLTASLTSKHSMSFDKSFGQLWDSTGEFLNADVVLILDCCFGGLVTRGMSQGERSVEIVAAVGGDQQAFGISSQSIHMQVRTFTSRLADEIVRVIGAREKTTTSFADIVASMRKTSSPDRFPEYLLKLGKVGARIKIPNASSTNIQWPMPSRKREPHHGRSCSSGTAPPSSGLMAVFKIHLENSESMSSEVRKLVQWIHALHPSIGLELNGVFQGNSTEIIIHAPWPIWAVLRGLPGFDLICETTGRNRLKDVLSQAAPPRQSRAPSQPQILSENIPPPHL